MLIVIGKNKLERIMSDLYADALERVEGELKGIKNVTDLSDRVKSLREQCEKMEIEKGRKEEEGQRREREIEHKIGLERKRQEFELTSGKRDAVLQVREENLTADRKRFEEQMKFQEERFTKEVGYLKEMLAEIVKRLPSAEFTARLSVTEKK